MNVKVDVSNVVLTTERLILRAWTTADLDDFFEYARVDGVGQMAGWLPHKSKEESAEILSKFIASAKTFALEYCGKVIGSLGIEEYHENELPEFADKKGRELGFVLSKDYWGLGLMTEEVGRVVKYCFDDLQLDFLVCGHFVGNHRSARVQEKCGFVAYKNILYTTKYGEEKPTVLSILKNYKA